MMHTFACYHYPLPQAAEPRIDRTRLIDMFQTDQEVDENGKPKSTFGNGAACYSCHAQFGPHAQLFVRFDEKGVYKADATGLQDPAGEVGRSLNGLFTSHMKNATEAKAETSQMLGKPVANLQEAAKVLVENPGFIPCQAENVIAYALRLSPDTKVKPEVLEEIATKAREKGDPSFGTLVIQAFSHPGVIASVVAGIGMGATAPAAQENTEKTQ